MKSSSPSGDYIEEQLLLDVDEGGEMIRANRNQATIHAVELRRHFFWLEHPVNHRFRRQWLVLVLGEERCLVLQFEIHRVLDRGIVRRS